MHLLQRNARVFREAMPHILAHAPDKDPKAADVHFLFGYHYLTCGHQDAALREFRRVVELQPKDAVAAARVATLTPRDAQPSPAPAEGAAPKPVPPDEIAGTWTAAGSGSAKYSMSLQAARWVAADHPLTLPSPSSEGERVG